MKGNFLLNISLHLVLVGILLLFGNALTSEPTEHTWQINHYGSLKQFQPLSGTSGIGISEQSELITLDLPTKRKISSIDLKFTDSDTYALLDSLLVTYSTTSSTIHIFEKYSGIFVEKVNLESPPVHFGEFYNNGLLILDSRGSLTAWNKDIKKVVGKYDVKSFMTTVYEDLIYVSLGSSLICLNDQAQNIITNVRSSSDILDLKDGLAISKTDILSLKGASSPVSQEISFENPSILAENLVAEIESERFTIYKVEEGKQLDRLTQHAAPDALSIKVVSENDKVYVVAILGNGFEIHDFTKFVKSEKLDDIVSYERLAATQDTDYEVFLSTGGSLISFVASSSNEVNVLVTLLSTEDVESSTYSLSESLPRSRSILIDKPRSASQIAKTHYLAEESHRDSPVLRMIIKLKHHLSQLGRAFVNLLKTEVSKVVSDEDVYGFLKLLVAFDDQSNELIARNTRSSAIEWKTKIEVDRLIGLESLNDLIYLLTPSQLFTISARTGTVENTKDLSKAEKLVKLSVDLLDDLAEEGFEPFTFGVKSGSSFYTIDPSKKILDDQFYIEEVQNSIQAYKIVDEKLLPTWNYKSPSEKVLKFIKNHDQLSPASGIAKGQRKVLYKYLNPNLVTLVTEDKRSQIAVHLLDGITGSVLHVQRHQDVSIDPSTINVIQNDNWVIYSYVKKGEKYEQHVYVIDLFSDGGNASGGEKSAFDDFDIKIHNALSKTFIFPERIELLSSSATRFGITVRSIIALTESGSLVEIPKFMFNSRRIDDRAMVQTDAEEFKMMPYEPVIGKPDLQVLNGNQPIKPTGAHQSILVQATNMESSSLVCYVDDATEFCTIIQPSSSYDILKSGFDKRTLLLTIGILFTVYGGSKHFVRSKKLNAKWLD